MADTFFSLLFFLSPDSFRTMFQYKFLQCWTYNILQESGIASFNRQFIGKNHRKMIEKQESAGVSTLKVRSFHGTQRKETVCFSLAAECGKAMQSLRTAVYRKLFTDRYGCLRRGCEKHVMAQQQAVWPSLPVKNFSFSDGLKEGNKFARVHPSALKNDL